MIPHFRHPAAVATVLAALVGATIAAGPWAAAAAPAAPPRAARSGSARAPARDTLSESPPGPLLVPPAPRAADTLGTHGGAAPVDTALASRKRKAREDLVRGMVLEEQKAYAAAIISYMNAARADPDLKGASYRIGRLYASRQQWDAAARAFREELRREPNGRAPRMEYAVVLAELGDTTRAIRMLEDLTRRAPGDADVWRSLGFVYGRAGRYADAEKALRGSIGLDGKSAQSWRDLGVVLAAREQPAGARDAYRHAIALDPADASTLVNLANLESRAGDHVQALEHYHEAERRDSSQAFAYQGQVRELVALGRVEDAGAVWRRWLALDPADPAVREGTARHFVHIGRVDAALEVARDGVRRSPGSGDAWWLMGEMYRESGDARSAAAAYRRAASAFRAPADRARADSSLAAVRSTAPDSLRALFAADSTSAARADSARAPVGKARER